MLWIGQSCPVTSSSSSGTTVLFSSRRKWLRALAISVVFNGFGTTLVMSGDATGWIGIIFFGPISMLALVQVVHPSELSIDAVGMTSVVLWRRDRYDFHECSEFRTWRTPSVRNMWIVVFDYDAPRFQRRLARMNKRLSGANASLPDTYGLKAEALVELLNGRRDHVVLPAPNPGQRGK